MTRLRFAILLLLMSCGAAPKRSRPQAPAPLPSQAQDTKEQSEEGKWVLSTNQDPLRFRSDEGARIYLVPVLSKADPTAAGSYLVRITGSHSPHDGLVLLVQRREHSRGSSYVAQLKGSSWVVLEYEAGHKRKWASYGYNFEHRLGRLHVVDESFDAEAVLALRVSQRDTPIREFETLTRAAVEKAQNEQYAQLKARASEVCGPVTGSIDWSTVQPEWPKHSRISDICGLPIRQLAAYCEDHPRKGATQPEQISISCKFQGDPSKVLSKGLTRISEGNYSFTPGIDKDSTDFLVQFFRQEFGETEVVMRNSEAYLLIKHSSESSELYTGSGGAFYPVAGASSYQGNSFAWSKPQLGGRLDWRVGKWILRCKEGGQKPVALEELVGKERQAVLLGATFETLPKWKRIEHFLARDSRGSYYYVDRYKNSFGGGHFRVFVGRKGQMKLSKLKRLVEDSEGTLFSTARGDLRLVVTSKTMTAVWIRGKKVTPLTTVTLNRNQKLIYDELGVYYGEKLGLICN